MLPTRDPPQTQIPIQNKTDWLEKKFQANGQEKTARVAIIKSDKIDFKTRDIKGDPEGHFIILKVRIYQDKTL